MIELSPLAKEKKEKEKKSSAGGKTHPPRPTKTGQSGTKDTNGDGKEKQPSSYVEEIKERFAMQERTLPEKELK